MARPKSAKTIVIARVQSTARRRAVIAREVYAQARFGGGFQVGTSRPGARAIFRQAFSNWRTRITDVDELVEVRLELSGQLRSTGS